MIHIVIPYIHSNWGQELKYSIRSIEMYLEKPYDITIIGQCPDYLDKNKINFIKTDNHLLDGNPQKRIFANLKIATKIYNNFIFWQDDIYLLNYTNQNHLNEYYHLGNFIPNILNKKRGYGNVLRLGYLKALELGIKHPLNHSCHVPIFLNSKKLIEVDKIFNLSNGEACIPNAYCTYYNIKTKPVHSIRAGFWGKQILQKDIDNLKNYRYLNHDDYGLKPILKEFIKNKFPNKSKYEI